MGRQQRRIWIPAVVFASVAAFPAVGTAQVAQGEGLWELGAFVGIMDDRPQFEANDGLFRIAHEGILGAHVGYSLPSSFFLEAEVAYAPLELGFRADGDRARHNLKAIFLVGRAGYNVVQSGDLRIFPTAGGGFVRWSAGDSDEIDFAFNGGVGGRYFIARGLSIRAGLALHFLPSALATTRRELRPDLTSPGVVLWLVEARGGVSFHLGGGP